MKLLLSHPTGNANVRAAAKGFNDAGILGEFRTSIATFQGSTLDKLSEVSMFAELQRRRYDISLRHLTRTYPWLEIGRILSLKAKISRLVAHEKGFFSIDKVYNGFDKWIAGSLNSSLNRGISAVYAYEDGAMNTFKVGRELGLECFYDLPIGYWKSARTLLASEMDRWPDWVPTLTGFKDSISKLEQKDEELRLADQIFVASSFTAKTLDDFDGKLAPVHVIPYGFPHTTPDRVYQKISRTRRLKVLFVGGLSQRKGIADLFAAVDQLSKFIELTIVGNKANFDCAVLDEALKKHKWIQSLPHSEILRLMKESDVLVFPSLFEGFGLVITEAMSQGTPVITTERTAGPDLIIHEENGWLIEAASTESIQRSLEEILSAPEKLATAGRAAMQTASKRPWRVYEEQLANRILKLA